MNRTPLTESLEETLAVFDGSAVPLTTTEVAESLGLGRRSTYERLRRLVDLGRLETKTVGASARVWWRPQTASPGGDAAHAPDWPAAAESLIDDVLDGADVGVFVLDETYEVAWINEATERYFGLDRERVVGRDKRRLVDERIAAAVAEPTSFADTVLATYDDNTYPERFTCRVRSGDGREERWLEHRSKPIESGAYAGGRVELYYDITEQRRTEHARRTDRTQLESLIGAVEGYAISRLDGDGRVRTWNEGAERIKGYAAEEILGEHVSTLYTGEDRAAGVPERNLVAAAENGSVEDEGWRVRADGSTFWAHVTITSLRDENGELGGFVKVTRDLTERRDHERELRREHTLIRRILDVVPVSIGVVAPDGEVTRANRYVADRLEREDTSPDEYTVGTWDLYRDGEYVPVDERPYMRVFETADPVSDWECQIELPTGERHWLSVSAVPLGEDGEVERVVVCAENVTAFKEQARRLERQRDDIESELADVFDRVSDGFYALDADLRFTYLNDRAGSLLGVDPTEVVGLDIRSEVPLTERFEDGLREALERREPASFEDYYEPVEAWFENAIYPSETGLSVYFRDVTERKEHERRLEESEQRYRTLAENFPNGAVGLLDGELRHTLVEGRGFEQLDFDASDLRGKRVRDVYTGEVLETVESNYRAALEGEPNSFELELQGRTFEFRTLPLTTEDGTVFAAMAMSQDVTERKEHERRLREAKLQLEAATEAGAIGTWEWQIPEDRFVAGRSFARTFGVDPDAAREGVSIDQFVAAVHEDDLDRVERAVEAAIADCGSYEEEYRVWNVDDELRWVLARGHVRCDDDGNPTSFPGALVDITERKRAEEELERRREQLAALNGLNEVVRDITEAVIEQSSREEIERVVCERLAASDSYLFAWTGEVDGRSGTVTLRTEAGVEGYLDDVTITVDPDDERSLGPTGRAVLEREIQTTQDIHTDDRLAPWRGHVEEHGFRSSAAVPIVHEDTIYGVLNVYADRPDAFEGPERSVIAQLGEVVGYAIAATDRKRALLGDEIVELEFRIRDILDAHGCDVPTTGTIDLDHVVPIGDGDYLAFGSVTADAVETIEAIVEQMPHWKDVTLHTNGAGTRFELRLSEPTVLSSIASLGGSLENAAIEDGDYRMTVHLPPSTDVGRVIDAVRAAYPGADMLKRRQIQRDDAAARVRTVLESDLTDRQRATLEAAYHAGFFEWPRAAAGEDVAASLDIAASTFHQHLRKAQGKVFGSLLSGSQLN